jgi:ribosomal protein L12E/L44/L45/RPP1/RPP2
VDAAVLSAISVTVAEVSDHVAAVSVAAALAVSAAAALAAAGQEGAGDSEKGKEKREKLGSILPASGGIGSNTD